LWRRPRAKLGCGANERERSKYIPSVNVKLSLYLTITA